MPKIPKWIGDAVETVFSGKMHTVNITGVAYLHPKIKQVRLQGNFENLYFAPGQAVAFRVDENNYRNYTPSFFDAEKGLCDIVFYLHSQAPGSAFANKLQVGDTIKMITPRGRSLYRPESKYHFFFGDETTLGLFKSLKNIIDEEQQNYIGVLELQDELSDVPEKLGLMTDAVPKSGVPAENAIRYLDELDEVLWKLWRDGTFYLMGNATSIQHFRNVLKQRGINRRNIVTQAYWMEGRVGL